MEGAKKLRYWGVGLILDTSDSELANAYGNGFETGFNLAIQEALLVIDRYSTPQADEESYPVLAEIAEAIRSLSP